MARQQSRILSIIGWILTGLVSAMILAGFAFGITHQDAVAQQMNGTYGYPMKAILPLLIVEGACVVIYLIPKTAGLGAVLLTGYLGGAVATHVHAGEANKWFVPIIVGVVVWLGLYFRDPRVRDLMPIRK